MFTVIHYNLYNSDTTRRNCGTINSCCSYWRCRIRCLQTYS